MKRRLIGLFFTTLLIATFAICSLSCHKKTTEPDNFTIVEVSSIPVEFANQVCKVGNLLYIADTFDGFKIANVAEPANPFEISSTSLNGDVYGIVAQGDYAYVPVDGLQVFNCSDPTNPSQINSYSNNNFACYATISDNKLFLALNFFGIMIFDITDPNATLYPDHLLGSFAVPGYVLTVKVSGDYAYVTEDTAEKGLRIYDISNLANPLPLGYFATTGSATGIEIVGNYAYLCDYDNGVFIINISDPNNPYQVGHYQSTGKTCGLDVVGNLMYVAAGSAGLRVVDASIPSNPIEITRIETSDLALDVQVYGNFAYVSAKSAGVRIIQVAK